MRFIFILPLMAMAGAASSQTLKLREAVQYALAHSPKVQASQQLSHAAALDKQSAFSAFLPSLDFEATHGLARSVPTNSPDDSPYQSQMSVTLAEKLYDNGESWTRYTRSELERQVAEIRNLQVRDQLILDVQQAFGRLSLARALWEINGSQVNTIKKQAQAAEGNYRRGLTTKTDYVRFKIQLQRAQTGLMTAENNFHDAELQLRQLLGAVGEPLQFAMSMPTVDAEVSVPQTATDYKKTYEYRIARMEESIAEKDVEVIRQKRWPELYLNTQAQYLTGNYWGTGASLYDNQRTQWSILLNLKYNIWDWGTRMRDVQAAEARRLASDASRALSLDEVQARLASLFLRLKEGLASLHLARDLLASEQEGFAGVERQYREGKIAYLDLSTSLDTLLSAKTSFYTAYFDLVDKVAQHQFYEGSIYESMAL